MAGEEVWDLTVLWCIDDYAANQFGFEKDLRSPDFTVEALENSKWHLSVFLRGMSEEFLDFFLYKNIENTSEIESDITFKFNASIGNERDLSTFKSSYLFTNGCRRLTATAISFDRLKKRLRGCGNQNSSDALILECSLKRNNESEKLSLKKEIRTRIVSHKCSFHWKVKFLGHSENVIGKKHFCLGDQFFQVHVTKRNEKFLITIRKLKRNTAISLVVGKIGFLDVNGLEVFRRRHYKIFWKKFTWKFPELLSKPEIIDNVSEYVKDGNMSLHCEFSLSSSINELEEPTIVSISKCHTLDSLKSLRDDFRRLLLDNNNFDLKLIAENNVELKAHRSVLAARSPVFCAMFDREMLENRTGIIKIEDVDSKTLESFVSFLYAGVTEVMDSERAMKLLILADRYQMPSLIEFCASFLMSALSTDNVCNILMIADMVRHEQLKYVCSDYAAHHVTEIVANPNFSEWIKDNSELTDELKNFSEKL